MYQSPYFITECKKRMLPITSRGFRLVQEKCEENWAILRWQLDDIWIAIEYHPYAYSLNTYIDYRGKEIDVWKLYELAGIDRRPVFQFGKAGLDRGIEVITDTVLTLLGKFDHRELTDTIKGLCVHQETTETYFIKKADMEYLSGNFGTAKRYYEQYENYLNDTQRKRLNKIRRSLEEK